MGDSKNAATEAASGCIRGLLQLAVFFEQQGSCPLQLADCSVGIGQVARDEIMDRDDEPRPITQLDANLFPDPLGIQVDQRQRHRWPFQELLLNRSKNQVGEFLGSHGAPFSFRIALHMAVGPQTLPATTISNSSPSG